MFAFSPRILASVINGKVVVFWFLHWSIAFGLFHLPKLHLFCVSLGHIVQRFWLFFASSRCPEETLLLAILGRRFFDVDFYFIPGTVAICWTASPIAIDFFGLLYWSGWYSLFRLCPALCLTQSLNVFGFSPRISASIINGVISMCIRRWLSLYSPSKDALVFHLTLSHVFPNLLTYFCLYPEYEMMLVVFIREVSLHVDFHGRWLSDWTRHLQWPNNKEQKQFPK